MPASLREFGMTKNMKPPEPDFVTAWREWVKQGPPRCCHTCQFYNNDGECDFYHMVPPPEFVSETSKCDKWIMEIPF